MGCYEPRPVCVTKLDPAALRHGTRLRCGGGKHQSKVSEIYYRHKTVFMDGPTSRSVPCNWPPPGHVTLSHTYICPKQRHKRTRGTRRRCSPPKTKPPRHSATKTRRTRCSWSQPTTPNTNASIGVQQTTAGYTESNHCTPTTDNTNKNTQRERHRIKIHHMEKRKHHNHPAYSGMGPGRRRAHGNALTMKR